VTNGTHGSEGDRRSNAAVLPDNKSHYPRDIAWHEDTQRDFIQRDMIATRACSI
jgi:hypothetical protein